MITVQCHSGLFSQQAGAESHFVITVQCHNGLFSQQAGAESHFVDTFSVDPLQIYVFSTKWHNILLETVVSLEHLPDVLFWKQFCPMNTLPDVTPPFFPPHENEKTHTLIACAIC